MDFLKLHFKGDPFIIRLDSIMGFVPAIDAKKGKPTGKYILVTIDEGTSGIEVDETFEEIGAAMADYEVEIIEVANDHGDD